MSDHVPVKKPNDHHREHRNKFLLWFTYIISSSCCLIPPSNKLITLAVRRTMNYKFFKLKLEINETKAINYF